MRLIIGVLCDEMRQSRKERVKEREMKKAT